MDIKRTYRAQALIKFKKRLDKACDVGNIIYIKKIFKDIVKYDSRCFNSILHFDSSKAFRWACDHNHIKVIKLLIETISKYNPVYLCKMINSYRLTPTYLSSNRYSQIGYGCCDYSPNCNSSVVELLSAYI